MRLAAAPGRSAGTLSQVVRRAADPPVREVRFWVVQAMVAGITVLHLLADLHSSVERGAFPGGLPVALLILPVGYAALHYGLSGSAATGLWAALLWLPDLLLPHDRGHAGSDIVNLALVEAVAFFVGQRIEAERLARAEVERTTATALAVEARYRRLVIRAEEDERARLARELHDEPLQLFLHLARSLERLAGTPEVPTGVADGLSKARVQAIEAAGRLRTLARNLRPPALDQLGFVPALTSMLADVEEASGTPVDLAVEGPAERLDPDIELGAFRIAEEAVRNAVRHADPSRIDVGVSLGPGALHLVVHDDGRGFAPEYAAGEQDGHLGILGMDERARLLGGQLRVRSSPGTGTTVEVTLPLASPAGPSRGEVRTP